MLPGQSELAQQERAEAVKQRTLKQKWDDFHFWNWWRNKHDNYQRATLLSWIASAATFAFLLATGQFFEAPWYQSLIQTIGFPGAALSGSTYIAYLGDKITRAEKAGNFIFFLASIGATVACGVTGFDVPFLNSFDFLPGIGSSVVAYSIFGINNCNWMQGFGQRFGSQWNDRRPANEKKAMAYSGLIGAALGSSLFVLAPHILTTLGGAGILPGIALASGAAAAVAGTGGLVLGAIVAGWAISSLCKSCADYVSKAYNYGKYRLHRYRRNAHLKNPNECPDPENNLTKSDRDLFAYIDQRKKEHKGAFYGVAIGLVVGVVAAALTVPALPFIGLGVAVAAGAFIVVAAVAACGSLFSKSWKYFGQQNADRRISQDSPARKSSPGARLDETPQPPSPPAPKLWRQKLFDLLPRWRHSVTEKSGATPSPREKSDEGVADAEKPKTNYARALADLTSAPSPKPSAKTPKESQAAAEPVVIAPSKTDQFPRQCMTKPGRKTHSEKYNLKAINDHAMICADGRNAHKTWMEEMRRLAAERATSSATPQQQTSVAALAA